MKWFNNLKIKRKLILSFIVMVITTVTVGFVGVRNIKSLEDKDKSIYEKNFIPMDQLNDLMDSYEGIRIVLRDIILDSKNVKLEENIGKIRELEKIKNDNLSLIEETIETDNGRRLIKEIRIYFINYDSIKNEIITFAREGKYNEAVKVLREKEEQESNKINENIHGFAKAKVKLASDRYKGNMELSRYSVYINYIVMILAVIIALLLGVFISKLFSKKINSIVEAANKLSKGDILVDIKVDSKDELGLLGESFKTMAANIKDSAIAAEQIAAGNMDVEINVKSDKDILSKNLNEMKDTIKSLIDETNLLIKETKEGNILKRGDKDKFKGGFRELLNGVNKTMDVFVEMIDEVPAVMMMLSNKMDILYINKAGEKLLQKSREDILGTKCYGNFKTGDCNSPNCACMRAMGSKMEQKSSTSTNLNGNLYEIDYAGIPILGGDGNVKGCLELIVDQSAIRKTERILKKQAKYQEVEVKNLIKNLEKLSMGDLEIDIVNQNSDEDTKEVQEDFEKIKKALKDTTETLKTYVLEISDILKAMSGGNINQKIERDYRGEFTKIRDSINSFSFNLKKMIKDIYDSSSTINTSSKALFDVSENMTRQSEEVTEKTEQITKAIEEITDSIKETAAASNETSGNVNTIAASVEEMSATIRNLASASEETSSSVNNVSSLVSQISSNVNNVSLSARDVSSSVNSVATAVKEINISLNDVSKNCERSINITMDAGEKARDTNVIIEKLNNSSKQIGKIVGVINDIADQTNMLALNAAIEAAGAGEAGKGFAVVANEVKELAKQTAEATDEISDQIDTMRGNMTNAVKAMETITTVISEITDITNTIASAVTEQSAATGSISSAVIRAAERVNEITREIEDVALNTENAATGIKEASKGVVEIAHSTSELSIASTEVAKNTESASLRVSEIAKAANDIYDTTNKVSEGAQEISAAAYDTTKGSVKTSDASRELKEISSKLDALVSQFKIQ